MADMLQSRYQRHTASGIVYHLQKFPSSIVAKFALNYKKPGQKPLRARIQDAMKA